MRRPGEGIKYPSVTPVHLDAPSILRICIRTEPVDTDVSPTTGGTRGIVTVGAFSTHSLVLRLSGVIRANRFARFARIG